jgi:Family of unknown function (DUF6220)
LDSAARAEQIPANRTWARTAYLVVIWLFVACSVVQVFLAGLGVFAGAQNFLLHKDWGYAFGLLVFPLIALAVWARMGRLVILGSIGLFVLFVMQSVLLLFRASAPPVAALHPLNGFLILGLSLWLAFEGRRLSPPPLGRARA